uniref:monodehydroascorbate reductase (NADH) n=1 Tax=Auxenochlorella protothecoides TaxID=3075 RepID=A0A1D1ZS99_AUXPR
MRPLIGKGISVFGRYPSLRPAFPTTPGHHSATAQRAYLSGNPPVHGKLASNFSMSAASKSFSTVLLGGGVASGYFAREWIKEGGKGSDLAIISDDTVVAYERPALSKAYLFPEGAARLPGFYTSVGVGGERQDPTWYSSHGIEYLTETAIKSADLKNKTLTTEDGTAISFEKLVIGTGARVTRLEDFKTPGADLEGVYYLRKVADADALLEGIAEAKKKGPDVNIVIVGGGYIGMEVGAGLVKHGVNLTLVFPESRLMERLLTPELAGFYEKYYEGKGVKLIKKDLVTALEGTDGKVTTAVLKSGKRLPVDLVVVGTGARPNVELFKGAVDLLEGPPGGIKVDGRLQTSAPGVFAVGDVAAFKPAFTGELTRQEHVTNARLTGAYVAREILTPGTQPEYDYLPFFYSREFDLSWQFYGQSQGDPVHFGDQSSGKFGAYWIKDGTVVGAFLESGSEEENAAIKKVIQTKAKAPSDLQAQGLAFAASL